MNALTTLQKALLNGFKIEHDQGLTSFLCSQNDS